MNKFNSGIENNPEGKYDPGRRELLKSAGKTALFGLGSLFLGNSRLREVSAKPVPQESVVRKGPAAIEREIIDSVSEKLRILEKVLPERGEVFASEHESIRGLQVGKPYREGKVAWFAEFNQIYIGFEEWTKLENEQFRMRYWRFRFVKTEEKYTLGHWTWGETVAPDTSSREEVYEEPLGPNEESVNKLKLALDMLMKEFAGPKS